MSANLKKWLAPVALIILSSWYFANNFSPTLQSTPLTNQNNTTFTVNGLTYQPGSASTSDPDPRYRVYFFPGNGTFIMGHTPADGQPFVYNYTYPSGGGSYGPFAEATLEYGDGVPPPAITPPVAPIVVGNGGTSSIGPLNLGGMPFLITPVRKVVPGHELTYVVTFENPMSSTCTPLNGTVEFNFDDSKMNYLGDQPYTGSSGKYQIQNYVSGSGIIQWTFTNLIRGDQRNVFLRLQTETEANGAIPGTALNPVPSARFVSPNATVLGSCNIVTRTTALAEHSAIASVHDPNQKTVSPVDFCVADQGNFDFMITFQNDGYSKVKDIHIEDELDVLLANCCSSNPITLKEWSPRGNFNIQQSCTGGKFKVTLQNINLPGTRQPGYGQLFGENDTKGYIKFQVPKSCLGDRPPCSAICNRAMITFDCNPPLETNLAMSRIKCNLPPDDCNDCVEIIDTLGPLDDPAVGASLGLPGIDLSDYTHFKWYPATGLSDPLIAHPVLLDDYMRTYTLVASGPCKRLILYVPVEHPCMSMQVSQVMTLVNCVPTYDLTLTTNATVFGINPNTLEWHDCTFGAGWSKTGLPPGNYYFSVKDPATGCFAEQWVNLPGQAFTVTDDPNDCIGNPVVTGATGPLTYAWTWNQSGVIAPFSSNQPPPLNLQNKTNVVLTVTDQASKCAVTIPISARCNNTGGGNQTTRIALIIAGIVGLLVLIFAGLKMYRKP